MDFSNQPIEVQKEKAFVYALRFLSFRARSEKEIENYLQKKNFNSEVIQATIEQLKSQKLISDTLFAESWTRMRQSTKHRSKLLIKQELKQKGIDEQTIETTLSESQEDFQTAKELFEKKKDRFIGLPKQEFLQKAGAFLQRRGFSWGVVSKVLKEYVQ